MTNKPPVQAIRSLPPKRASISLIALALAPLPVLILAPDILLVVFAGLLFGVFFGGGGGWLARRLGIAQSLGVCLFLLLAGLALTAAVSAFAPVAADQFDNLVQQIPPVVHSLRTRLVQYAWGQDLLDRITPSAVLASGAPWTATSAITSTFGALGSFVVMLFIGLYGALDPAAYRRGAIALLAPSLRSAGEDVIDKAAVTLRNWLIAQLIAMTIVGVLTWLGLWIAGVPLAPILGFIAGLLTFIPNLGPILGAAPGVLLGFSAGPTMGVTVIGIYLAVQTLESYFITPWLQQERVSLAAGADDLGAAAHGRAVRHPRARTGDAARRARPDVGARGLCRALSRPRAGRGRDDRNLMNRRSRTPRTTAAGPCR